MKKTSMLLSGLALALLTTSPVFADTFFNFSFTGNSSVSGDPGTPFSGSGVFDAVATKTADEFKVVGVTGTTDGEMISSLIAKGGFGFNDNFLFFTPGSSSATLDNSGVAYQLANGVDVSLFQSVPSLVDAQQIFGFPGSLVSEEQTAAVSITPQIAATPEPGSIALLGTGVLGMAGMVRRKFAV